MRGSAAPVSNFVAPPRSIFVPMCNLLVLVRGLMALPINFYGAGAQDGWRRSIRLYGGTAQVNAVRRTIRK